MDTIWNDSISSENNHGELESWMRKPLKKTVDKKLVVAIKTIGTIDTP